jgi:hypothetical protein
LDFWRARQTKALGEPPEDPLLLFFVASVTPLHFAESLDRNGVVMMNAFREARAKRE